MFNFMTRKVRRVTNITVKLVKGKEEHLIYQFNPAAFGLSGKGYPVENNEDVIAEVETQIVEEPIFQF